MFIRGWHNILGLPRQIPSSGYRDRLREELRERQLPKTRWQQLSETSDIFFSSSRARHDGVLVQKVPPRLGFRHLPTYKYMLRKNNSRWSLYRTAAIFCDASLLYHICEVVNASKDSKLDEVASRCKIDPAIFREASRQPR